MDFPEGLPASVTALAEFSPMEDVALHVLRTSLPDITSLSRIPDAAPGMFILVGRDDSFNWWSGDPRFVDVGVIQVDVFTTDPDGDEKGALVSEAVRVAMRDAGRSKMEIPGRGWIHRTRMTNSPGRKSDWATAQGPVQYADLPEGTYRYEAKYELAVRAPIRHRL